MSTNINGSSTMSNNKSSNAPKRVVNKKDEPVAAAAPVTVAPAPVAAAAVAGGKKKVVAAAAPTPVAAPVAVAPVASEVTEAVKVEVKSVDEQIKELVDLFQKLREQSTNAVKTLQKMQKQVAKELKEAGRSKRKGRAQKSPSDGEKRPTIFTTPVTLRDPLCAFLGLSSGSQMTPADVTRAFSAYVESHKLKDAEKGHTIHPDAAMRKVLGVKEGEPLTYRNIQSYLYKLYVLPEKKNKAAASA